ncbi:hypothetical protein SUGI_0960340 [Cryptomeria japonica]|nr:hypothetical protein SUGI_0960340 [Cryptomeria japonica]
MPVGAMPVVAKPALRSSVATVAKPVVALRTYAAAAQLRPAADVVPPPLPNVAPPGVATAIGASVEVFVCALAGGLGASTPLPRLLLVIWWMAIWCIRRPQILIRLPVACLWL